MAKKLLSERLAAWMETEYTTKNVAEHGANLWAFYSTLTGWATHIQFTRATGNDHAATTRIERDIRVAQMMRIVNDTMSGKAA